MYKKIIFGWVICIGGWAFSAKAQLSIANGKVSLEENSVVAVKGDVLNNGNITNKGVLTLSGNWINSNNYISEQGTISLVGDGLRVFDHNHQDVHNLFLLNGGNVRLLSNLNITGKLKLDKGIITPKLGAQLVLTESASIEGGSADAYVDGTLYHTGVGSKFYPIGKHGQYAPVTLAQVAGNDPVVGLEFHDTGLTSSPDDVLQWLGNGFFWQLTHLSGDFEGSPIILNIDAGDFPPETEDLVIAVSNNLTQGFGILAEAEFHTQGNRYVFSSSSPVQNPYITVGIKNTEKYIVYIPNVLSPLAPDPEDRAIKIYSEKIAANGFQWIIRDRWGYIVYTTDSYTEAATTGWQGNAQHGNSALPGVYHYTIRGKFNDGTLFSRKGNIVLLK